MSQIALKKKESEGSLTTSGTDDVLTLALGNPEHPGRIRGVGGNVRRSTYFHLPKRRKQSVEQTVRISVQKIMEEEREKIVAEERAYWVERFMRLEAKIDGRAEGNASLKEPHTDKQVGSGQGSCSNLHEKGAKYTEKLVHSTVRKSLDLHLDEDLGNNDKMVDAFVNENLVDAISKEKLVDAPVNDKGPKVIDVEVHEAKCQVMIYMF